MRFVVAGLVITVLALGIWLFWPQENVVEPATTTVAASPTTTVAPTPTTAAATATSTTGPESHVVTTVEEAEEILRELWFGWFEGIYNQNIDRIREVVILEETVQAANDLFGQMAFSTIPTADAIQVNGLQILRSDSECLALFGSLDVADFRPEAIGTSGVYVIRRTSNLWKLMTVWTSPDDLWETDCAVLLP